MKNKDLAGCIIVNQNNEGLLQKKTLDYKAVPGGYWCIFGGGVEKGETPEYAARRELKEETGLAIKIKKIMGIYPGTYPSSCPRS